MQRQRDRHGDSGKDRQQREEEYIRNRERQTDDQGQFELPNLAPGSYDVEVSRTGFATQKRLGINLNGTPVVLEFVLDREAAPAAHASAVGDLARIELGIRIEGHGVASYWD